MAITFVPHLIPVDQGLMATCYSLTDARPVARRTCASCFDAAYAGEPFVDVVDEPAAHLRTCATPTARACTAR